MVGATEHRGQSARRGGSGRLVGAHVVGAIPADVLVPQSGDAGARLGRDACDVAPVLPRRVGDAGEIRSRAPHDRRERRILDRERAVGHLAFGVPSRLPERSDDAEVVPVLLRRRALLRRHRLDVASLEVLVRDLRSGLERLVPRGRVVHARLPRVDDDRGEVRPRAGAFDPREPRDEARPAANRSAREHGRDRDRRVNRRAAALTGRGGWVRPVVAGSRPVDQTSGPGK